MAFDGENLTVNLIKPDAIESGDFIYQHDVLLREGCSEAHEHRLALLDLASRQRS